MKSLRKRGREIGIAFEGITGPLNAITDVRGVTVGQSTVITEKGSRTGVTAIFPKGGDALSGVSAGVFAFNGTGELTGAHQIKEFGGFFGPILLTGTTSVGTVSTAYLKWVAEKIRDDEIRFSRILPVVGETWDGNLNEAWDFHLTNEHVYAALNGAADGPVPEGNVGGGTGMIAYGLKGGTGTSSRQFTHDGETFTVGVLVQANHGLRSDLQITGVPVGRLLQGYEPILPEERTKVADGSILIVIGTDAPLLSSQLERVAKRATVGLARTGGFGGPLSGDIFIAFSTATDLDVGREEKVNQTSIPGDMLDGIFHAAAWATEEAIVNSMLAAETMTSANGLTIFGLPPVELNNILDNYRYRKTR